MILNLKEKTGNKNINFSDNDCIYMHLLLPSDEKQQDNFLIRNKTFYEVGCKVFEINKIYK